MHLLPGLGIKYANYEIIKSQRVNAFSQSKSFTWSRARFVSLWTLILSLLFFIPTPSTICACRQNVRYPSWFGHLLQTRCKNLRLMGGKLGLPFIAGRVFWCCCRNLPVIHKLWKISMWLQLSWGIQTMKWHLTPKLLPYRFVFVRCLDTRYMCANSPLQALASRLWIPFNLDGLREVTSKDHLCVRFFKR